MKTRDHADRQPLSLYQLKEFRPSLRASWTAVLPLKAAGIKGSFMKTAVENLQIRLGKVRGLLEELQRLSSIERWYYPNDGPAVWLGGHFKWKSLDEPGRHIQATLLDEQRRLHSLLRCLMQSQSDSTLRELDAANETSTLIQQDEILYTADVRSHFASGVAAVDAELGLLDRLPGSSNNRTVLVPDTNALVFNPALETWKFQEFPEFTLVLTPPVLAELDAHKVSHRVPAVREKAERLIRQIKEYRRRAATAGRKLSDGVPILTGVSDLAGIAAEPRMNDSLPWLDPANQDDRLLASVIEIMRLQPRSPVLLVTRDINLQNKAELADIPYIEPPDPT